MTTYCNIYNRKISKSYYPKHKRGEVHKYFMQSLEEDKKKIFNLKKELLIFELKIFNECKKNLLNDKNKIIKISKNCEKTSIIPFDIIQMIINERFSRKKEIIENYKKKNKIFKLSRELILNDNIILSYEDVDTNFYSEKEFLKYLKRILLYFSKKIFYKDRNYLNQYIIRVRNIKF